MDTLELIAARAEQVCAEGHFDQECMAPVPSPCIAVCRMSADRSHCIGCFRTLDEIRMWSRADSGLRRVIWAAALGRAGLPLPGRG